MNPTQTTSPEAKATRVPPPKAGDPFPIKYKNGQMEQLTLPDLPTSKLLVFTKLLCEERQIEAMGLALERNQAWVDSLTFDCYNATIKLLIRQNFPSMVELAAHDPIIGLRVGPIITGMAMLLKFEPGKGFVTTSDHALGSGNETQKSPAPAASAGATPAAA